MGIRENELRVGNWVLSPTQGEIQIENGWQIDEGEEVKPIPLTEEWLFKFGFKFDGHCSWWKNKLIELTIDTGEDEYSVFNDNGDYITLKGIKYVHSLQNLYFALTGEELTIKTINHK
jgi:hypothetical protein